MDGEAWWAVVHGVAQSWTRLKRLSSSLLLKVMSFIQVLMKYLQVLSLSSIAGLVSHDSWLPETLCQIQSYWYSGTYSPSTLLLTRALSPRDHGPSET